MNLVLLSGNGKRGKQWLEQVDAALAPQFDRTYRHDYLHWETGEPEINLGYETGQLRTAVQDLSPYMVFAKSAGTMLASKAAYDIAVQPKACLFVGIPLVMIHDHNLPVDTWLGANNFPITILQHSADPYGSFRDVEQFIAETGRNSVTLHELPGDTHDYLEFDIIKDFVEKLAQGIS